MLAIRQSASDEPECANGEGHPLDDIVLSELQSENSDEFIPAANGASEAFFDLHFSTRLPATLWDAVDSDDDLDVGPRQASRQSSGSPHSPDARRDLPLPASPKRRRTESAALATARIDATAIRTVRIQHASATRLEDCGLQIWRGALLMGDWLLYLARQMSLSSGATGEPAAALPCFGCIEEQHLWLHTPRPELGILEVGAGAGVVALIAAHTARFGNYLATDFSESVLRNAKCNLASLGDSSLVKLRTLDLKRGNGEFLHAFRAADCPDGMPAPTAADPPTAAAPVCEFSWSTSDLAALRRTHILIGADVIFDDELTICLVAFLTGFFRMDDSSSIQGSVTDGKFRVAYFAIERRSVFTVAHRASVAPAVECLLSELRACGLTARIVDHTAVPQFVLYERGREMLLLRVTGSAPRRDTQ